MQATRENWKYNSTYSGVPQGSVVSPILSNLVLDKLDKYVERELIPANTRGLRRSVYPPYRDLTKAASIARKAGNRRSCTETEPTGAVNSVPRPQWPKLPSPLVHKVRRRFSVRSCRFKIRSCGNQTENCHVFTWRVKAGTSVILRRSLAMQEMRLLNSWVMKSTYYMLMINMTTVVKDVSMVVWD